MLDAIERNKRNIQLWAQRNSQMGVICVNVIGAEEIGVGEGIAREIDLGFMIGSQEIGCDE